jgi:hypothetical protein
MVSGLFDPVFQKNFCKNGWFIILEQLAIFLFSILFLWGTFRKIKFSIDLVRSFVCLHNFGSFSIVGHENLKSDVIFLELCVPCLEYPDLLSSFSQ